ncbi:MAG: sulfotransferase [Pseudomonadales bacterium]
MSQAETPMPLAIRTMNRVGQLLDGVGISPVKLNGDDLLKKARKETGLNDFGDDSFLEPMALLLNSLRKEAQLNMMGRIIAKNDVLRLLKTRLQIIDTLKRHPEILEQEIAPPLIVIGPPRTGTTVFHDLLACDHDNRVPLSWETSRPCPPPEAASYLTDPRIAENQAELDQVDKLVPDFKKMHPMGAERAQECVAFTSLQFTSMIFDVQYRVPTYEEWTNTADVTDMFKFHRQFLQLLQWKHPGKRWALKSPQHLWHLEALLKEYPDACIVQTHRDPVRVLVSVASLIATLRRLGSDQIDLSDIAAHYAGWLANAFEHTISVRESGLLPDKQVIDIHFNEFVKDQVGCVQRAYQHFGLDLKPEIAASMQSFIDDNPADKHGKHLYQFSDTGLDLDEVRQGFQAYEDYFSIKREVS